jgi:hypothetical protein
VARGSESRPPRPRERSGAEFERRESRRRQRRAERRPTARHEVPKDGKAPKGFLVCFSKSQVLPSNKSALRPMSRPSTESVLVNRRPPATPHEHRRPHMERRVNIAPDAAPRSYSVVDRVRHRSCVKPSISRRARNTVSPGTHDGPQFPGRPSRRELPQRRAERRPTAHHEVPKEGKAPKGFLLCFSKSQVLSSKGVRDRLQRARFPRTVGRRPSAAGDAARASTPAHGAAREYRTGRRAPQLLGPGPSPAPILCQPSPRRSLRSLATAGRPKRAGARRALRRSFRQ